MDQRADSSKAPKLNRALFILVIPGLTRALETASPSGIIPTHCNILNLPDPILFQILNQSRIFGTG